jgi:hypothetical protein
MKNQSTPRRAQARRLAASAAMALTALAGFGLLSRTAPSAVAAPEPSPVPRRWQLDVECAPLRTIVLNVNGQDRSYWYLAYKVTNNSKSDVLLAPMWELSTDSGKVARSGREVPVGVTREIMNRLDNPYIEDQIGIVGNLLRGPENAKEGVVVWPATELHLSDVRIYGAGFSGENATVEIPGPDGKLEKKVLRKTLMLRYLMPGDVTPGDGVEYTPDQSQWIMR